MKRRSKAGSKTSKAGRYKAATPKPTISPNAVPGRRSRLSGQKIEIARFIRERDEALQQQAATSEVLRVISNSPGDLELIFRSILVTANRICEAHFGTIFRYDGKALVVTAWDGVPPEYLALVQSAPILVNERTATATATGRAAKSKQVIHIADISTELVRTEGEELRARLVELGGVRTILAVPMLKDAEPIGVFTIYRQEVRPFTDKQIELLKSFAAQAVIAIENARLLNELRERTDDLSESLQQQTATADVLKIISRSAFDLQTVFETLVKSAAQLCEADAVALHRPMGETYPWVASLGYSREYEDYMTDHPIVPNRDNILGHALLERRAVQITDPQSDPEFTSSIIPSISGMRTVLGVPLLRESTPIGVIVLNRRTVRPFTDKQIELVTTFADQAVIAIENVRLFEAEQQRTSELRGSLEQQTATAEVLRVISSSPGELQPVFQAMLENATRICEAKFGVLNLYENGALRMGAMHNVPAAFAEWLQNQRGGYRPIPGSPLDNVIRTKQLSVTVDHAVEAAPGRATTLGGARSTVCVPMIKDDQLVGTITIYRQEVRPFTDKQMCAANELRRPGRHRHREHAAAQRAT